MSEGIKFSWYEKLLFWFERLPFKSKWKIRLDAIIRSADKLNVITVDDLPSANEILGKPNNIAPLKARVEKLNYLLSNNKLDESSYTLLRKFIANCEDGIAAAEQKKDSFKIPWRLQINMCVVAILWLVTSAAPVFYLHHAKSVFRDKSVFYFEVKQRDDSQNEKSLPSKKTEYKTNWGAILGISATVLVYLIFYVVLTVVLFRTIKALLMHHRRQLINEDLSLLNSVFTTNIDPADTATLEARKNIFKVLMREDNDD